MRFLFFQLCRFGTRSGLAVTAAIGLAAAVTGGAAAQPALVPVRISFNPHFISYTALDDAIDKGYFKAAGIDLQITKYQTSANSQLPSLARGDLDITVVVPGPALFNQYAEGFDAKIVASIDEARAGYLDGSVLVVRKDLVGTIKKPADLAGKNVDGAFAGSPIALLTLETIEAGGLKPSDVTFTTKESAVPDQLAALTNKVVDVQGTTEPTATVMQQQGVGTKWISYRDVMPGYQEAYWGVSAGFAKDHPDVVTKFVQAYLRGATDVAKSNGKLTPDLVALISKWTEIPADVIQAMGATPFFGQAGAINTASLEKVQKFWISLGLVKSAVPIDKIVDPQFLAAAKSGK
jgi:ABC-type nitrate/sulfonate/bicarbonate transport system substrate-binding protein